MTQNQTLQSIKGAISSLFDPSQLRRGQPKKSQKQLAGTAIIFGGSSKIPAKLRNSVPTWQKRHFESESSILRFETSKGLLWLVRPHLAKIESEEGGHLSYLELNDFSLGRDQVGSVVAAAIDQKIDLLNIEFQSCSEDIVFGALVGADLANYQYKNVAQKGAAPRIEIKISGVEKSELQALILKAAPLAQSINLARHLVNLPPNHLYPESFVKIAEGFKRQWKRTKIEIWRTEKLKKEKMELLLAVGAGSANEPRLIRFKYRGHNNKKRKKNLLTVVGKGITFDTGGVNLKPASGMRLMKKDMGGSAAVFALAYYLNATNFEGDVDIYLALAENAVGSKSFRPGDIYTSRSGQTVEIHNTDAEGRLVLADALSVAIEDEPSAIIDVATLTGAIKAGLGAGVGGLFGNNDELIQKMMKASQEGGDPLWPMPLYRKYKTALKSTPADVVNANDGFGGAITAALFLEVFVKRVPWLHLDIYSWKDSSEGALGESGGSGQAVQALTRFVEHFFYE